MNEKDLRAERRKGIFFIILAGVFFSLMSAFVRLSGDLPVMEKAFFRNLIAAIAAWIIIVKDRIKIDISKSNIVDLLLRSICGTIGLICNFYAVAHLNISDANLLNKLSPFFAIIMSIIILKEKAHKWDWIAVIVAFLGALLVIKPGFNMDIFPAVIGMIGGYGAGVAYTFVRKLGKKGLQGPIIVMFFSTFSTLALLPTFLAEFKPFTAVQFVFLMCIGLSATGGQLCITAAYTHAAAKDISVYDYLQVVFAAVWGFFFFGQIPDMFSFLGYLVIFAAVLIRFLHNKRIDK